MMFSYLNTIKMYQLLDIAQYMQRIFGLYHHIFNFSGWIIVGAVLDLLVRKEHSIFHWWYCGSHPECLLKVQRDAPK